MQHRDTWNPHLYSGTGTSQRVCHQPASKLECRTNAHAAQRHLESTLVFGYGYLAKSLPSTRFQAGVPHECQRTLHVGQHTPLLADENAPRRSIPRWGVCLHTVQGHCRRLAVAWLSEPFALGTVCSRNRLLSEPSSAASRVSASGQRVPRDECGWHGTSSRRAAAVRARPRSACPLRWGRTIFNEIPESPDRGVLAAIGTFLVGLAEFSKTTRGLGTSISPRGEILPGTATKSRRARQWGDSM